MRKARRRRLNGWFVAALSLAFAAGDADAAQDAGALPNTVPVPVVMTIDPQAMVDAFTEMGYAARLMGGTGGDPLVTITGPAGAAYQVLFFNCYGGSGCEQADFHVDWTGLPQGSETRVGIAARVAVWNARGHVARAGVDANGRVHLDRYVSFGFDDIVPPSRGISQQKLIARAKAWISEAEEFKVAVIAPSR